jgi:hypothetical protein
MEQDGMVFALSAHVCDGRLLLAARIEEVVVTETGCEVISLFPQKSR